MRTRFLSVVLLAGVLAGCGNEGSTPSDPETAGSAPKAPAAATPTAMPITIPPAAGLVTTGGPITVLAENGGAPEACIGGVLTSLPPQCGGPALEGFSWEDHQGDFEEANGIRWGEFVIVGRFDGTSIEVTKVVPRDEYVRPEPQPETDRFRTPCPTPDGGWTDVDPSKAGEPDQSSVFDAAAKLPGYADSWIGRQGAVTIINVRVTGDIDEAVAALRQVWGGPLCVSHADRDHAEIRSIGERLGDLPGVLSWGGDNEPVEAQVIWDDGSLQNWADRVYGEGVVTIRSALQPAPADR